MLKRPLLWVALVLLPGYSYSEEGLNPYHGYTGNAAANGLNWTMKDVLPSPPGLDINSVIYRYTINKETDDTVDVYVQNENANGTGYIFREHDQWKPGSLGGTQINKIVPVTPSNRSLWGDGSIDVDGPGTVTEPNVVYTYRVEPCYDPQFNPGCPGYKPPVPDIATTDYDLYDPLANGDADQSQYSEELYDDEEDKESDEEKEAREEEEEKDRKERLEKALAAADTSALFAQALAQTQMLDTMNLAVNMNTYYAASINGGTYAESVSLVDKQLPENKRGLRNGFAQQLLHQRMVDMQYK